MEEGWSEAWGQCRPSEWKSGTEALGTNGDWWRQVKGRHSRYANVEAAAWSQGLTFGASETNLDQKLLFTAGNALRLL